MEHNWQVNWRKENGGYYLYCDDVRTVYYAVRGTSRRWYVQTEGQEIAFRGNGYKTLNDLATAYTFGPTGTASIAPPESLTGI